MSATNLVLIGAALLATALFLSPRLLRAPLWRATVTPLASIIGSGFLVCGPILAAAAGTRAWLAMAALCGLAYLFGAAIRHNIRHLEREIDADDAPPVARWLERASDVALSLAYFVSVAYYLNLFAAFGLRLGGITDPFWIRVVASAAIAGVGAVGLFGGLAAMERLAVGVVGIKLSLIAGVLAALGVGAALALHDGGLRWPALPPDHSLHDLRVLLGLVILVQGFETSRYLGAAYDGAARIRTMRWAQWISTAIYLAFILLITRYFTGKLPAQGGETQIIDMLAPLGAAVAPMIIGMALSSQLSAAVADSNGASGLISESFRGRVKVEIGNLAVAAVALVITWTANIYEIIAHASRLFVAYYALQSLQATLSAWRQGRKGLAALYAAALAAALLIVVFAVPADA